MKLTILPIVVASAVLASANPMRVVVVSSSTTHSVSNIAHNHQGANAVPVPHAAPCGGARLRQKATSLASAFTLALGFGHKDVKSAEAKPADEQRFKALPFFGTPASLGLHAEEAKTPGGDRLRIVSIPVGGPGPVRLQGAPMNIPMPMERPHGHMRFYHHHGEQSFLMRVHFALMSLGPWEGRAVAFVLGCGIGALLRMFFVLAVVTVRLFRGPRAVPAEGEYMLVEAQDAEEIFVTPPVYTYPIDEKVVPAEAKTEEAK
ncbi:hypothetical protein B0H15DRAFT_837078 [Mycena belliarum]|uniref:Uncharacterized protein n=1 Tax=Mycena belliarum TaxID=1033014 RepID=A0AAD6U6N2_9AGAR|nr:hypothetical protein B0H15DRAFT_837078 [Mycena belliae]